MILRKISVAASICLSTLVFINCSKKNDTSRGSASAVNYSPLTANSSWTYLNTPGSSFTLTATSRDTVANGNTYRVLTNSLGGNNYLRKDGSNYYRFASLAELNISALEELYLKADQPVNGTWMASQIFNITGFPIPITANLNYTIKEKGITRTVSGKAFSNVTHVRLDISLAGLGAIGGGDFYYAEGIGLIENAVKVNAPGQAPIDQTMILTAYVIK